ncbi:MAG: RNA 2',3'-cyclic 3'-phosphodiesterase [Desulfobacteraceae bacterium Eth-SRB1]|nr:MAG: RNA 2',3'-cyclic 3'-phosphodiesterase [Desulfobacteraceae bacterium Eth-SRB1]
MIRIFIAFELPEKIIIFISKVQKDLQARGLKVKWVRPQNIHLTLKFLGNINETDTEMVGKAIRESACGYSPILLTTKGIGVFPNIKRPRVIWIGIAGQTKQLVSLQKGLDEKLDAIGFPKDNRPFTGHLTIARVKGKINPQRLIDAIKYYSEFESETFIADNIYLFKSDLKSSGAVYTKLSSITLE